MHTQAFAHRDRGCGDAATNWKCPVAATESWRDKEQTLPRRPQRKCSCHDRLILAQWYWVWTSGLQTLREYTAAVLSHHVCGYLLQL